jgi:hypothetical protein
MAGVLAGTVSPAFTGLFANLQPHGLPQPMHPLDVHTPAILAKKKNRNPAIPKPRPLQCQPVRLGHQATLVVRDRLLIPLTGSRLADGPADPTLEISQPVAKHRHRLAPIGWAYKFFEEISIASFMISMSIR